MHYGTRHLGLIVLVLMLCSAVARAEGEALARYLDGQTFAVARFDLGKLDLERFANWLDGVAEEPPAGEGEDPQHWLAKQLRETGPVARMLSEAGAREAYVIFSFADLPLHAPRVVVPLEPNANVRAIAALVASGKADGPTMRGWSPRQTIAEQVGSAVVFGEQTVVERMRGLKPVERPELMQALAATEGPVQLVVILTEDTRRVIEELMPRLPKELGGGASTAITRGMLWASVALTPPPEAAFRVVIQSADARAAADLKGVIRQGVETAARDPEARRAMGDVGRLVDAIEVEGDRLRLVLKEEELSPIVQLAVKATAAPRTRALRVMSANNLKQLGLAAHRYAGDHAGRWPEDLLKSAAEYDLPEDVLVNPIRPQQKPGYIYVRPETPVVRTPGDRILAYEAHDQWGEGINILFADGHVEWWGNQQSFEKALREAKGEKPGERP